MGPHSRHSGHVFSANTKCYLYIYNLRWTVKAQHYLNNSVQRNTAYHISASKNLVHHEPCACDTPKEYNYLLALLPLSCPSVMSLVMEVL